MPSQDPIGITSIVLGERHLHRVLRSYFAYYRGSRTQLSLGKDAPALRTAYASPCPPIPHYGHHR